MKTVSGMYKAGDFAGDNARHAVFLPSDDAKSTYALPDYLQETSFREYSGKIDSKEGLYGFPIGDQLNLYDRTAAQALNLKTSDSIGYEIPNLSSYGQGYDTPTSSLTCATLDNPNYDGNPTTYMDVSKGRPDFCENKNPRMHTTRKNNEGPNH